MADVIERRFFLSLVAAMGAFGFGRSAFAQNALPTVATFSILGDFVREIGGARVSVQTLVGPGGDVHRYAPGPQDARALAQAKAIFENGLGFEGWMTRLAESTGAKAPVVTAAKGVTPRVEEADEHGHEGHGHGDHKESAQSDGHDHGDVDPHAWLDVANAKIYVANVAEGLARVDPAGAQEYEANKRAYTERLAALDGEIRAALSSVPKARRKFVAPHRAFGYFAAAYGLEIVSPFGGVSEGAISARDLAKTVQRVRREKIPAIFWDSSTNKRVAEQIAHESGAWLGGALYADSLSGADGPAATYLAMMRYNSQQIVKALSG